MLHNKLIKIHGDIWRLMLVVIRMMMMTNASSRQESHVILGATQLTKEKELTLDDLTMPRICGGLAVEGQPRNGGARAYHGLLPLVLRSTGVS